MFLISSDHHFYDLCTTDGTLSYPLLITEYTYQRSSRSATSTRSPASTPRLSHISCNVHRRLRWGLLRSPCSRSSSRGDSAGHRLYRSRWKRERYLRGSRARLGLVRRGPRHPQNSRRMCLNRWSAGGLWGGCHLKGGAKATLRWDQGSLERVKIWKLQPPLSWQSRHPKWGWHRRHYGPHLPHNIWSGILTVVKSTDGQSRVQETCNIGVDIPGYHYSGSV